MKVIDARESRSQEPSRPEARALQFNLRTAWLRELERAQLQGWFGTTIASHAETARHRDSDRSTAGAPGHQTAVAGQSVPGSAGCPRRDGPGVTAPAAALPFARGGVQPESPRAAPVSVLRTAEPVRARASDETNLPPSDSIPRPESLPEQASVADLRRISEVRPAQEASAARASAGAPRPLPDKPWPARSLHMMSDGSGARVWIRDAGIAQGSAGAIASTLAGELRQRGLRLRALTLNGRTAFEAEPASGSGKGSQIHSSQEVNRHGND